MKFKISKNQNLKSLVGRFLNHCTCIGKSSAYRTEYESISFRNYLSSTTQRFFSHTFTPSSVEQSAIRTELKPWYSSIASINLFWIFLSFSPKSIVHQFVTRDVGFRGHFHDISLWILRAKRQKWRGFSRIRANFAGFLLHTSGSFLFKISTTVSKCMNYQLSNKNKKKLNI